MTLARHIHSEAVALLGRLPEPYLSPASRKLYLSTYRRMMEEDVVEPLRAGDARDTYNVRRAALHAGTWIALTKSLNAFQCASESQDRPAARRAVSVLGLIVERCGPAVERNPPMDREQSSFSGQPSRWAEADGVKPRRGKSSKKHALKGLPDDWCDRVWAAAIAENSKYLDALAIHVLSPVRPAELVPGQRDGRFVAGVQLRLEDNVLAIEVAPVKSHGGKYGTGQTCIRLKADHDHPAIARLVALCQKNDGTAVVSIDGTNPMRKAMAKLGRKALGDVVVVTGYLFRNQCLSDLKATVGAGTEVAAAAGHSTDRTQARYGRAEHGRRRGYFISASAKREPTGGNVQRASNLKNLSASHDRLGKLG